MERELVAILGTKNQKGSMMSILKTNQLWRRESIRKKIKSLIFLDWVPTKEIFSNAAYETLMIDIFGTPEDYGNELYDLMDWHNSRDWNFDELSELDIKKADALQAISIIAHQRHREITSFSLNLNLATRVPELCYLVNPMVIKIPVISMRYFLYIHCSYSFNSIRKAKHPFADDLISYLYEVLFIQQKIAISLHEYIRLIAYTEKQKMDALFINAEINAIMAADNIFSYLKASIEKIIILIGYTHGITNLDSKKTHKMKLAALTAAMPVAAMEQYYCLFVFEFIKSENLDELNNYRSGLLHKKGIADLQPHNYVAEKAEVVPLKKIFQVLLEQHAKNTAVLIGALAMLTDELVRLDP